MALKHYQFLNKDIVFNKINKIIICGCDFNGNWINMIYPSSSTFISVSEIAYNYFYMLDFNLSWAKER